MDLDLAFERARAGDNDAIAVLYRAYAPSLLAFLLSQVRSREDAEDLLGEVFLAAVRDLSKITGDASGFRAWLYRVATNRTIDLIRRRGRRPEEALDAVEDRPGQDRTDEVALARAERDRLWVAVRALPDEQRRVVALRLAGGLSSGEIAEILGKRPGAVKALQHRALLNLTRALRGTQPYPDDAAQRLDT